MFWVIMAIITIWLYWLWTRRRFYTLLRRIDGPKGLPLIGMAHRLVCRAEILKVFEIYLEKYGNFVLSWLGTYPFVVICDPQLTQDILSSSACINKGIMYESLDDSIGRNLFNLKDPQWTKHRKFLQPAFNQKVLQSFLPNINLQSNDLLSNLMEHTNALPINLMQTIQEYTLTLAIKTTAGIPDQTEFDTLIKDILKDYQCILEKSTEMCFSPWLRYSWIRRFLGHYELYDKAKREIRHFIQKMIKMKLYPDELVEGREDSLSFLRIAIDLYDKKEFSLENVADECNGIILGAFETTANLIFYTLIMLAMHNKYQEILFEELQENFPNESSEEGFFITYNQIKKLVYLDAVVKEVMRVFAPVPLVSRSTCKDVPLSNGIVLPSGIQIVLDIFHLHRRKDIWGIDAHLFNPQHFPINIEDKHPYAFIPFTKGLRNCIGWRYGLMVAKITLVKLLRNFRFSTDFKYSNLEFVEDITLKFKHIPLLFIHKRYFD